MEEMLEVVTYHLPRYEHTVKMCETKSSQMNPSNLTFATKFLVRYLFIKVNGSRPMTYQYLSVGMVNAARENGGFKDQKTFKTAGKYGFDYIILTDISVQVLDGYINFVRPLLKPQCEVSTYLQSESTKFCLKIRNVAPPLPKCTIRIKDRATLP